MTWLWILGIIGFLLFLLCMTRVGAYVVFGGDVLTVDVKFGLFKFHILPGKEKKPDPEAEVKNAQKKAEADAKKEAKKAAKQAEKEARKGEKLSVKTERLKSLLADIQSAIDAIWPPLKQALNRTRKGICIHPLQLSLTVGGSDDPAAGAQMYGYIHAGVWTVMPVLERILTIHDPYIHVGVDFDSPDTKAEGEIGGSIRIGTLLAVGFTVAIPALKWFLQWKQKKRAQKRSEGVKAPAAASHTE